MAVNFGQRLGFDDSDLVLALLISNFIGFPETFIYGFIAHHLGAKKGLYLALFAYIGVCLWAVQMTEMKEFYILSFIIGLFQVLAFIPGASRAGVTITGARFLGFNRSTAAIFSMLLSIPIILASLTLTSIEAFSTSSASAR